MNTLHIRSSSPHSSPHRLVLPPLTVARRVRPDLRAVVAAAARVNSILVGGIIYKEALGYGG